MHLTRCFQVLIKVNVKLSVSRRLKMHCFVISVTTTFTNDLLSPWERCSVKVSINVSTDKHMY